MRFILGFRLGHWIRGKKPMLVTTLTANCDRLVIFNHRTELHGKDRFSFN